MTAIAATPGWRQTQNGWTISLAPGVTANIQLTRKAGVRWNLMATGACDTVTEAQDHIEALAARILKAPDDLEEYGQGTDQ